MSEEQMNDLTFSRLFIIMMIVMTVLTAMIMVLASFAASDVNAELDARSELENSASIENRIAPVGQFATQVAEAAPEAAPITLSGQDAYASCGACHTAGIVGAPKLGDAAVWSARIAQGVEILYDHAINGFQGNAGMMPAKGGNAALSDDSVKAAVDYMLQQSL
jgi:cytochrome c5